MQTDPKNKSEHNFGNFSEEVDHIHTQVEQKESALEGLASPESREQNIAEEVSKYHERPADEVLHPDFQMQADEMQEKIADLGVEHNEKVDELIRIMGEKGLKNTLAILERLGNHHVQDDFHRFLVQYVAQGMEVKGLKDGSPMFKALNMRLFEVTLPEMSEEGRGSFSDLVRAMEQFYIGMMSLKENHKVMNHFTIELAISNFSTDLVFYAAVPKVRVELFEKQLLSAFPNAAVVEQKNDYNPFNEDGVTVGSIAELSNHKAYKLKTFEDFEQDPLNVILGTFSKLNKDGEGAAIQLSIAPSGNDINAEFKEAVDRLKGGEVLSQAFEGTGKRVTREIFSMVSGAFNTTTADKDKEKVPEVNQDAIDAVSAKMQHPILRTNLRLVASSGNETRASQILGEMESAFNQFSKQQSNELIFKRRGGAKLKQLLHNFSFRLFEEKEELLLNVHELTTMFHFPVTELSTPGLKSVAMRTGAAPLAMPEDGVLLGINNHRGTQTEIRMAKEDRVRHFYVIGQTGTGKTVLLKNMIVQDILNGHGVCYMDPHGTDIEDILAAIPEERMDDVIYFDPSDMERPMGLNMLEYDVNKPEQKAFVVNEMLSIFNKLFDMKVAGGPMFEQYFRNATMLVIEDPDSGNTLLEIVRVLADEDFRKMKLSKCKNQIVKQFWEEIAGKAGGDASLANMVPYITNKFDVFLSNDIMRMIVAQEKSSFNIREVMDDRKILLVNLAKGRLGDINSHLIGLIMVGKILMAALGRVDAHGTTPADFYLYIDEFQNVTTDSISAILSEARKYRLSLTIAHQFIAQLPEDIKGAVFGNVGSKAAFRISSEDAQFLETQFAPEFSAKDIMKIPNWNAYTAMLVNGFPAKPFNMATLPPPEGIPGRAEQVKQLSKQKYGRNRAELEALVAKKFESMKKKPDVAQANKARTLTPAQKQYILQMRKQKAEQQAAQAANPSAVQQSPPPTSPPPQPTTPQPVAPPAQPQTPFPKPIAQDVAPVAAAVSNSVQQPPAEQDAPPAEPSTPIQAQPSVAPAPAQEATAPDALRQPQEPPVMEIKTAAQQSPPTQQAAMDNAMPPIAQKPAALRTPSAVRPAYTPPQDVQAAAQPEHADPYHEPVETPIPNAAPPAPVAPPQQSAPHAETVAQPSQVPQTSDPYHEPIPEQQITQGTPATAPTENVQPAEGETPSLDAVQQFLKDTEPILDKPTEPDVSVPAYGDEAPAIPEPAATPSAQPLQSTPQIPPTPTEEPQPTEQQTPAPAATDPYREPIE